MISARSAAQRLEAGDEAERASSRRSIRNSNGYCTKNTMMPALERRVASVTPYAIAAPTADRPPRSAAPRRCGASHHDPSTPSHDAVQLAPDVHRDASSSIRTASVTTAAPIATAVAFADVHRARGAARRAVAWSASRRRTPRRRTRRRSTNADEQHRDAGAFERALRALADVDPRVVHEGATWSRCSASDRPVASVPTRRCSTAVTLGRHDADRDDARSAPRATNAAAHDAAGEEAAEIGVELPHGAFLA